MAPLKSKLTQWAYGPGSKAPVQDEGALEIEQTLEKAELAAPTPDRRKRSAEPQEMDRAASRFADFKAAIHTKLLTRLDLNAAENMAPDELRGVLARSITQIVEEDSLPINQQERETIVTEIQNDILGLGPLEPLLADARVSEIMVNGPDKIYFERNGKIERADMSFSSERHLLNVIDKIVYQMGRRIDEASPMVDARLPDGSRINAVIAPVALDGPSLTIRRFPETPLRMADLVDKGSLTHSMAALFEGIVKSKLNVVISGGTGSGKTTLLNILSGYIPDGERIITLEDTAELQLQQDHVLRLETRPPNIEGLGEISMRALVKNSLRMRPDRIVLGEIRGDEVIDVLQAMNTGHDGSLTTIHANSPRDALGRMEYLVGLSGLEISARSIRQQISSAINVLIQTSRLSDGRRRITSVHEITGMEGDVISSQEIFIFDRTGTNADGSIIGRYRATGVRPLFCETLKRLGFDLPDSVFDPLADLT
ncbi:MAG: CpaF family protein [Chakrabartia sp.]